MITNFTYNNELMAIIIRNDYDVDGINFVTPDSFSQQMAYMHHPTGHEIVPHFHNYVPRTVHYTQEVLVIKKGKLRVDFYNVEKRKIGEEVLAAGDIILLCSGGHGFYVMEEVSMVEIKQGPYVGEEDKERFRPMREVGDE